MDTLKDMMAVKWFLESLNDINYIPGVRLGTIWNVCVRGGGVGGGGRGFSG